jgi:hypothetical protein
MKTTKNKKWLKVVQIGVGLVIVLLIIFQCKKDVAVPQNVPTLTQDNINLISNGSFENQGQCTYQGWIGFNSPLLVSFSNDVPPGGGSCSISLVGNGNEPPNILKTYITNLNGTKIFTLTCWIKRQQTIQNVNLGGTLKLAKITGGSIVKEKLVQSNSSSWQKYMLIDTLTLQSGDSIEISLISTGVGPVGVTNLFDKVELKSN